MPEIAPTGQFLAQSVQPLHLSATMRYCNSFLQTPAGMFAVCGGAVAVWFLAGLISPRKEKRRKDGTQGDAETEN